MYLRGLGCGGDGDGGGRGRGCGCGCDSGCDCGCSREAEGSTRCAAAMGVVWQKKLERVQRYRFVVPGEGSKKLAGSAEDMVVAVCMAVAGTEDIVAEMEDIDAELLGRPVATDQTVSEGTRSAVEGKRSVVEGKRSAVEDRAWGR